jgi:hypothetical protein
MTAPPPWPPGHLYDPRLPAACAIAVLIELHAAAVGADRLKAAARLVAERRGLLAAWWRNRHFIPRWLHAGQEHLAGQGRPPGDPGKRVWPERCYYRLPAILDSTAGQ